jgi:hypothetical protein
MLPVGCRPPDDTDDDDDGDGGGLARLVRQLLPLVGASTASSAIDYST